MAPAAANRLHSVEEQQAALNLSQLAQSTDGIGQLVNAMVVSLPASPSGHSSRPNTGPSQSEASPDVVALMAQGDAFRIASTNLNSADVKALEVMLAQVEALKRNIANTLEITRAGAVRSEPDVSKNTQNNGTEDSMQLD